jgi:cobalt/nickel transport system permease protein
VHIPDGYLSPLTCAAAYAAAAPCWFVALRKVKDQLQTRLVPTVAVVSAFSFVIMMFNLPLPGGTTGHAVGLAVAPILLGPWAAMLAISIALFIQALFFGDGGITTFGANCVNMAIVGPWVAYWLYRLISGNTPLTSPRRIIAAAAAGYVAINVAALLAAVQFGIQPIFFHDGAGAPLYAPYALEIAIPAMMIGHLSFAGLAEAVISGGVVAYVQKVDPRLLSLSGPGGAMADGVKAAAPAGWRPTRALWAGLAVLLIASPLGLLAAGMAWGEWGLDDFKDTAVRESIAQASGNVQPPVAVPRGMERLSSFWTSPIPDYAPTFMHNEYFGYILSAMVGTGLIVLSILLLYAVIGGPRVPRASANP